MKKIISLILIFVVMFSASCDMNAPLRNKMMKYYSEEGNYQVYTGIVLSKENNLLTIEILSEPNELPNDPLTFLIFSEKTIHENVSTDDIITFTTAPMIFYNGHVLPIVSLKKEEEEYLTFQEGKIALLEWIQMTFD